MAHYVQRTHYWPFCLAVSNAGDVGIHDLHLEVTLWNTQGRLTLIERSQLLDRPMQYLAYNLSIPSVYALPSEPLALSILQHKDRWDLEMELPVVQARRTIFSTGIFLLGATTTSPVSLEATIYSSDSRPFTLRTTFELAVVDRTSTYQEILNNTGEEVPSDKRGG